MQSESCASKRDVLQLATLGWMLFYQEEYYWMLKCDQTGFAWHLGAANKYLIPVYYCLGIRANPIWKCTLAQISTTLILSSCYSVQMVLEFDAEAIIWLNRIKYCKNYHAIFHKNASMKV